MEVVFSIKVFSWVISNKTNLVTVGLWCQSLIQRSHLSCQILEVIPEFFLLPKKYKQYNTGFWKNISVCSILFNKNTYKIELVH